MPPALRREPQASSPLQHGSQQLHQQFSDLQQPRPSSQQRALRATVHKFGSLNLTAAERDAAFSAAGLASALKESEAGSEAGGNAQQAEAQQTSSGGAPGGDAMLSAAGRCSIKNCTVCVSPWLPRS